MRFDEVLAELPNLTPEQRQLLSRRLAELEDEDKQGALLAAVQLAALGGMDPGAVAAPRR